MRRYGERRQRLDLLLGNGQQQRFGLNGRRWPREPLHLISKVRAYQPHRGPRWLQDNSKMAPRAPKNVAISGVRLTLDLASQEPAFTCRVGFGAGAELLRGFWRWLSFALWIPALAPEGGGLAETPEAFNFWGNFYSKNPKPPAQFCLRARAMDAPLTAGGQTL